MTALPARALDHVAVGDRVEFAGQSGEIVEIPGEGSGGYGTAVVRWDNDREGVVALDDEALAFPR